MEERKKKKSLFKKIAKWVSITVLLLLIVLVTVPFLFKDRIVNIISNTINNNVHATVTFSDANLSLLKNFPLVSLTANNIAVANKAPFVNDTLFKTEELTIALKITELFKKPDETLSINSISTQNGAINIIFNKEGLGNFDIAKKETTPQETTSNSSFSFNLQDYSLKNIDFNYTDRASLMSFSADSIYHTGKGNFAEDVFNLETHTKTLVSFYLENTNYLKRVPVDLDAVLGIDLKNSTYTFKENTAHINQLPLAFDGFIQLVGDNQEYDLHFKTPTSSFKNALALLPKQYAGNLSTVKTEGNFNFEGVVKGTLSEKTVPTFNIKLIAKDAFFKYADLPKAVKNIYIDTKLINTSGFVKDTYVDLKKLDFKIDEDAFSANGSVKNITTNPLIKLFAKGTVNLANISKVYPLPDQKELKGIVNANITTNFDMNAIEKENYVAVKNSGKITLADFKYNGEEVANPFFIDKTEVTFNSNTITLNEFEAKTGTSDLSINGNLENFYGFIFKDEVLKGNFALNSTLLKVSDFLTVDDETSAETPTDDATLKIPSFLDCKFSAKAKKVVYDNINLSNVSGNLYVHDETVDLQNLKSDIFGGNIGFNGTVSTKEKTPNFKMDLDLKQLNVSESFTSLEMLKSIAPIAKVIEGKLNSTINLAGSLNGDMTPNLESITGNLLGQLTKTKVTANNSKMLSTLNSKVNFLDADKLNLNGVKGAFSFKNGIVNMKPMDINYKDVDIKVSGKHGFNKDMNYDLVFDVPTKYLGSEVTGLIAKLSAKDANAIKTIPVKGNLTGSFSNPNFSSNLKGATSALIKNLIEKQKNNLLDKGKNKLTKLLGVDTATPKKDDTTGTVKESLENKAKDKVKDVLGGLFSKKKKKK